MALHLFSKTLMISLMIVKMLQNLYLKGSRSQRIGPQTTNLCNNRLLLIKHSKTSKESLRSSLIRMKKRKRRKVLKLPWTFIMMMGMFSYHKKAFRSGPLKSEEYNRSSNRLITYNPKANSESLKTFWKDQLAWTKSKTFATLTMMMKLCSPKETQLMIRFWSNQSPQLYQSLTPLVKKVYNKH